MYDWNPAYKLVINAYKENKFDDIFKNLDITSYKDYVLIKYKSIRTEENESMWTDKDSVYRECRSLVLDLKNEQIVLAPFRKFFNLEEYKVEENEMENVLNEIENADYIEILDKLDGSMLSARFYNNDYIMAGTMALDKNNSKNLKQGYEWLTDNYKLLLKENPNYTFCFEYISLNDTHTVIYKKQDEGLYLIGIRDVYTGNELPYYKIIEFAKKYNIKYPKIEKLTFNEVLNQSKKLNAANKEGWVINIVTNGKGRKIKIKTDDYIKLSNILRQNASINNIIKNIMNDTLDDLLSKVSKEYKEKIMEYVNIIYKYIETIEKNITDNFNKIPKEILLNKKETMIWIDKNISKEINGYIKMKYLGKQYNLLKNNNICKKIQNIIRE
jgi:hypothetical protein